MPILPAKLQPSVSSLHRPLISLYLTILVTPCFGIGEHVRNVSIPVHRLQFYDQVNAEEGATPANDVRKPRRSVPGRFHANRALININHVA